ncbi:MAG: ferritin-like domain-containing protein [Clostridiaceae bacterium]|nr:ferritin-like domain-containing protein [Clostridiaceae bacterium]
MYERTIYSLNQLILNQEEMIESYGRMIKDIEDHELKKILKNIQESHFTQMMVLSDRIIELGGNPKFDIGLIGTIDDMRYNKDRKKALTDLENARVSLDAEKFLVEKLSFFGIDEIEKTSMELIQKSVNTQKDNIKQLEEYITQKEQFQ